MSPIPKAADQISPDEYVLIEQDRVAVTVLRRAEPGWQSELLEGSAALLKLPGIGVEIGLDRFYERTMVARGGRPPA